MRRTCIVVGVLMASGLLTSCVAALLVGGAAAGGAAYAYFEGDMVHTYPFVIRDVHQAAVETVFSDLGYAKLHNGPTELEARTGDDKAVMVSLEYLSDEATRVTVRIGTFGDEHRSYNILRKIGARLGESERHAYPDRH